MSAPAPAVDDIDTTSLKHCRCAGCYPNTGPAVALCGTRYTATNTATLKAPPADSCVVCADLFYTHCEACG